ncbi:hypothetical protein D3C75_811240 [compost metagenome]
MQAEGLAHHVQLAVVEHLVDARRIAQVLLLEFHDVGIQRLVALHRVALGVTLGQVLAQAIVGNQPAYLVLQLQGVGGKVFERGHGHRGAADNGRILPGRGNCGRATPSDRPGLPTEPCSTQLDYRLQLSFLYPTHRLPATVELTGYADFRAP